MILLGNWYRPVTNVRQGRVEWAQPHSLPRRREPRLAGRVEWVQPHSLPRRREPRLAGRVEWAQPHSLPRRRVAS
jgi:hypothetical protein